MHRRVFIAVTALDESPGPVAPEFDGAAPPVSPDVVRVADDVTRLARSFTQMRQQLMADAAHDVEWSSRMVLRCLGREGPLRAAVVAGKLNSDPSTISRQVASLVRDGFVERRADPVDGRASLLVLTDKAHEAIAEMDHLRNRQYADLLADWSARDLSTFADLLERFTDVFDSSRTHWLPATAPAERTS